jgi:hypothetical protein
MNKLLFVFLTFLLFSCENIVTEQGLSAGNWSDAERNSVMEVSDTNILFQFTCAAAEIPTFVTFNGTNFETKGTYTQLSGAVPVGFELKPKAATFKGSLDNKTLSMQIFIEGNPTPLEYKYTFQKDYQMKFCS